MPDSVCPKGLRNDRKILAALDEVGESGLTKTAIYRGVFASHISAAALSTILSDLVDQGAVTADGYQSRRGAPTVIFRRARGNGGVQ